MRPIERRFMGAMRPGAARRRHNPHALLLTALVVVLAPVARVSATPAPVDHRSHRCRPLNIAFCKDQLPYNQTAFPNLVGNDDPNDAEVQLTTYSPLIQVNCASELKFFLCSVYAPMCTPKVPISIGPCRPLCQRVKDRCEPTLNQFGFPWPATLNCSKFPLENNEDSMCMKGPVNNKGEPVQEPPLRHPLTPLPYPPRRQPCTGYPRNPNHYVYVNRTGRCAIRCHADDVFSRSEKRTAETISVILAALSFSSGLLALLLLRCSWSSLASPEVALVFVVLCTTLGALPHFARYLAGRDVLACLRVAGSSVLVGLGVEQRVCTVSGIFVFFFSLAAKLWWALLCWSWFLAVCVGWGVSPVVPRHRRFIRLQSDWQHVVAWGGALLGIIAAIVRQAIDADELSGVCGVAQQPEAPDNLLYFALIPEVIVVATGGLPVALLLLSLVCVSGERRARLGLFSGRQYWAAGIATLAYFPIATTLLSCLVQELYWPAAAGFQTAVLRLAGAHVPGIAAAVALLVRTTFSSCAAGRYQQVAKSADLPVSQPRPNSAATSSHLPLSYAKSSAPTAAHAYAYEAPLYYPPSQDGFHHV